jgi:hypothetical protein
VPLPIMCPMPSSRSFMLRRRVFRRREDVRLTLPVSEAEDSSDHSRARRLPFLTPLLKWRRLVGGSSSTWIGELHEDANVVAHPSGTIISSAARMKIMVIIKATMEIAAACTSKTQMLNHSLQGHLHPSRCVKWVCGPLRGDQDSVSRG